MVTPLPPVPQTSDPANFAPKADVFLAALEPFRAELDALAATFSPLGRNMLINAAFRVDQRNNGASTAIADDAYCFDRWYALTQTGAVAASQLADPENGFTHALRLTQSQAVAQRFGVAQIVEGKNCKFARGNSGTLTPRIRCSASTPIRYAILGWTGTEDVVTSDVVNSWTNATFTAGQFFSGTNLSVIAVGSSTPAAATWTTLPALSAALGTAFNNIIVMIWTEAAQAQNVTLDLDYVQCESGANSTPFERKSISQDLAESKWYYRVLNPVSGTNSVFGTGVVLTGPIVRVPIRLQDSMRAAPSVSFPDGAASYGVGSSDNTSGDNTTALSAISLVNSNADNFVISMTPSATASLNRGQAAWAFSVGLGRIQLNSEL